LIAAIRHDAKQTTPPLNGLREQEVEEAVMESTPQYWQSVWLEQGPQMRLHLAQAAHEPLGVHIEGVTT
jgi:hypothetical protein